MANHYASETTEPTIRAPVVRQTSWPAVLPQLALVAIAIAAGWFVTRSAAGLVWGSGAYLAYSISCRTLIQRAHRRGMRLVHLQQYGQAVQAFEESHAFFTRHAWLDRFRAITMMSASAMSFREMALCNIAFCYGQMGHGRKAKECYQRTLKEFPQSGVASAALTMMESVEPASGAAQSAEREP